MAESPRLGSWRSRAKKAERLVGLYQEREARWGSHSEHLEDEVKRLEEASIRRYSAQEITELRAACRALFFETQIAYGRNYTASEVDRNVEAMVVTYMGNGTLADEVQAEAQRIQEDHQSRLRAERDAQTR